MKTARKLAIGLGFGLFLSVTSHGQGNFQNLGFESAILVAIPGDLYQRVEFAAAFPGWAGFTGTTPEGAALYNKTFLDSAGIGIMDSGYQTGNAPPGVIAGRYTAILQAGVDLHTPFPGLVDTTLTQTSLVPANANSLRFRVEPWPRALLVFLDGQRLQLVAMETTTSYTVLAADIRSWQGQNARLDFTLLAPRPFFFNTTVKLDSIEFSPEPIPEPRMLGLFVFGALFFLRWKSAKLGFDLKR